MMCCCDENGRKLNVERQACAVSRDGWELRARICLVASDFSLYTKKTSHSLSDGEKVSFEIKLVKFLISISDAVSVILLIQ